MVAILDALSRPLYDEDRGVEYPPLRAMNDDVLTDQRHHTNGEPVIFCVVGGAKINSDIASNMQAYCVGKKIDLLTSKEDGLEEMAKFAPKVITPDMTPETQLYYETPYQETMLLISEMMGLEYDKAENTGLIRLREQSNATKDRYSSVSYGVYFANILARDMLSNSDQFDFTTVPDCVSTITL